jgi:hypothetical protein
MYKQVKTEKFVIIGDTSLKPLATFVNQYGSKIQIAIDDYYYVVLLRITNTTRYQYMSHIPPEIIDAMNKLGPTGNMGPSPCPTGNMDSSPFPTYEKEDVLSEPPIGLTPKKIHERNSIIRRFNDIRSAISRYYNAELEMPIEWIEEYNELIKKI